MTENGDKLPNLQTINMKSRSSSDEDCNQFYSWIATSCPNLEELLIHSWDDSLDPSTVATIINTLPKLRKFHFCLADSISIPENLINSMMSLEKLTHLNLSGWTMSKDQESSILREFPGLCYGYEDIRCEPIFTVDVK